MKKIDLFNLEGRLLACGIDCKVKRSNDGLENIKITCFFPKGSIFIDDDILVVKSDEVNGKFTPDSFIDTICSSSTITLTPVKI